MKVLVLGSRGQLGGELLKRSTAECSVVGFDLPDIDILNVEALQKIARDESPSLIVNAAAYTAVDKAEDEKEQAFAVNETGALNVAKVARELECPFIHVSTDYVFGGEEGRAEPYTEDDTPSPINVYGASKLAGERAVAEEYGSGALTLRTSSVHGANGNNFVHTMLRLIEERDEVRVVQDQWMCTTWAGWLAEVIMELSAAPAGTPRTGLLHASTLGAVTWYEFAVSIRALATFPDGCTLADIVPIPTTEYPTPAKRPAYSVMDCSRLDACLSSERIDWVEGLKGHLRDLGRLKLVTIQRKKMKYV